MLKASVRAKVDHPFHIIKNIFGHKMARYRGLSRKAAQLQAMFGLANLLIAKRKCSSFAPKVRPELALRSKDGSVAVRNAHTWVCAAPDPLTLFRSFRNLARACLNSITR